jgi:hypothetical protein
MFSYDILTWVSDVTLALGVDVGSGAYELSEVKCPAEDYGVAR